jgi:ATP adenylyltransferase
MNFEELKHFLEHTMRMSHIYQPVMIRSLLENKGSLSDEAIARELLKFDPSQLEYYQKITNNMVGRVLRNHKVVEKDRSDYSLTAYHQLSQAEIEELIRICDQKLQEYITRRGEAIWQHRKHNRGYILGTVRYEVLKRARFRCELCGISAAEKALEVDHIVPVSQKGEDSINNYQALCYSCNATKRDRDATDFRNNRDMYEHRSGNCLFCTMEKKRVVEENNLAYVILDKYPVTEGHCLIIPKRHSQDYFQVSQPEVNAIHQLIHASQERIRSSDSRILGFNIGLNCGEAAGQTIMHTHLHLIPRREGDVERPTGGIRNIIAGKGDYTRAQ